MKRIQLPLDLKSIKTLKAGDSVLLSGTVYTARDAAHKSISEAIKSKKPLPFEIAGQTIYYVGPTPARPGQIIGSAGPTTSYRMDSYTPLLLSKGLKGMIGKGPRSTEVRSAIKKHKAVYFAAIGGAGALISKTIKKAEIIAYEDLGSEAVRKLEISNFPAIVINDIYGADYYETGKKPYRS